MALELLRQNILKQRDILKQLEEQEKRLMELETEIKNIGNFKPIINSTDIIIEPKRSETQNYQK